MAPRNLSKPLIIEIFTIALTGAKIRLHNLKTIPIPISATMQSVNTLKVRAITLLTVKKINTIQTHETTADRIFTISFVIPLSNPFLIRHNARIKNIRIKIIFKSTFNTFPKSVV